MKEINCKYCYSEDIVKYGKTKNNNQIYNCKNCNTYFVNCNFHKNKFNPNIVHHILNSYFMKKSTRKISEELKNIYNFNVTHQTIHNWIKKWKIMIDDIGINIIFFNDFRYINFNDIKILCDSYKKDYKKIISERVKGKGSSPLLFKILERRKKELKIM